MHLERSIARLAALSLGVCGLAACRTEAPERPVPRHVLLIVIDTLRADHLGSYGHERPTSPALDALAARGVRFARAASQSSWTAPSMVSMMTGRYLSEDRLDIPEEITTLAQVFDNAGYATAAFLSNPLLTAKNGFHRGFDRAEHAPPYDPDDAIVEWLRAQADEATFTYIHLAEPHDPYGDLVGPDERRWQLDPPPLPPEREAHIRATAPGLGVRVDDAGLEEIRRAIGGYDDDILYCDRRIATFVAALEASGQLDDTAIVVTSDHGESLWTRADYWNGKRGETKRKGLPPTLATTFKMTHGNQVYTELVHVPLILVAPGLTPSVVAPWVENVDIAPTLLELCNLSDPGGLQGESLLTVIDDPEGWRERKPVAFSATRFVSTVVSQDGWQLVLPTDLGQCAEGLSLELFDLNTDPEARRNVAQLHPERVEELQALLMERRDGGLGANLSPDDADLEELQGIGYLGNGIIDVVREDYLERETDWLLAHLADTNQNCLTRLEAARALAQRELSLMERERLNRILDAETSEALLAVFD